MIEILITLVVTSVGFLALASMQIQGVRYGQEAGHKTKAFLLAQSFADRMRSNAKGVVEGAYDNIVTSPAAVDPNCLNINCAPTKIAEQDIYDTSVMLYPQMNSQAGNFVALLPSTAEVEPKLTVLPLMNSVYEIRVEWSDKIDGEATNQFIAVQMTIQKN